LSHITFPSHPSILSAGIKSHQANCRLGIIGLIAIIGISIELSFYFAPRPQGAFFPFSFGWLGTIFLIFIILWIAKWFFWP
jgi:predicted membrane channel-forming protein YqfA (hemolysin III family)